MKKEKKDPLDTNKSEHYTGEQGRIVTDPFGSYTGVPTDDYMGHPIQDADDL